MFQIHHIDETNYSDAYNFLKSVPSISSIEDSILKNGVIVTDNDKVIGSVSLEMYDRIGLIRYFVFKKNLSNSVLSMLMEELEVNAKKQGICKLVCVADNYQIEELFYELNFLSLKKKIFINEEKINATNFSSSNFLFKDI